MKYEAVYTVEISVGTELVIGQQIKAHDVVEVIEKLANQYANKYESKSFEE